MTDQQREAWKAEQMAKDADAVAVVSLELPISPLRRLQEIWEGGDDQVLYERAPEIFRDLFAGQDGHLHLLDEHLGCPEAGL